MITVEERQESRFSEDGPNGWVETVWVVDGTNDDQEAKTELAAEAPTFYASLPRQHIAITPLGYELWEGRIRYQAAPFGGHHFSTGESVFSFEMSAGTQHVTQSRQTMSALSLVQGQTAPDFKGAINVTADAVEGVSIYVPVATFSETHWISDANMTEGYKHTIRKLVAKTNDAAFKECAIGEALFLGASGTKRGAEGDWEVTFRFAFNENRNAEIAGQIIAVKGWEYFWARYEHEVDEDANAPVIRPIAAYVERLYDEGDFGDLNL